MFPCVYNVAVFILFMSFISFLIRCACPHCTHPLFTFALFILYYFLDSNLFFVCSFSLLFCCISLYVDLYFFFIYYSYYYSFLDLIFEEYFQCYLFYVSNFFCHFVPRRVSLLCLFVFFLSGDFILSLYSAKHSLHYLMSVRF